MPLDVVDHLLETVLPDDVKVDPIRYRLPLEIEEAVHLIIGHLPPWKQECT